MRIHEPHQVRFELGHVWFSLHYQKWVDCEARVEQNEIIVVRDDLPQMPQGQKETFRNMGAQEMDVQRMHETNGAVSSDLPERPHKVRLVCRRYSYPPVQEPMLHLQPFWCMHRLW